MVPSKTYEPSVECVNSNLGVGSVYFLLDLMSNVAAISLSSNTITLLFKNTLPTLIPCSSNKSLYKIDILLGLILDTTNLSLLPI